MTQAQRAMIVKYIHHATDYDASSVIVHKSGDRAGTISAKRDANKTFGGHDPMRYYVGHTENVLSDAKEWSDAR